MLAKILGNVMFYLLCASLAGCTSDQSAIFVSTAFPGAVRGCRLPQRMHNTPQSLPGACRALSLAPLKRDSSTYEFQFTA